MLSRATGELNRDYQALGLVVALALLACGCGRTALGNGSEEDASISDTTPAWDGSAYDAMRDAAFDITGYDSAYDTNGYDAAPDSPWYDAAPDSPWPDAASDSAWYDAAPDSAWPDAAPDSAWPDATPDSAWPDAAIAAPDLVIDRFTARVRQDDEVRYSVRVCNAGNRTAGATGLGLYYDRSVPPTWFSFPNTIVAVPQLAPDRCANLRHSARLDAGQYASWAFADPYNRVAESDEHNNVAGPARFEIVDPQPDPCSTICSTLVDPCGVIGQDGLLPCLLLCYVQPEPSVHCALQAAQSRRCLAIVTCLLDI